LLQAMHEGIQEPGEYCLDQGFLRAEMVVDRSQIDASLAGDQPQRGLRKPLLGEQLLRGIQNALDCFRLCHEHLSEYICLKHTFQTNLLSIRTFYHTPPLPQTGSNSLPSQNNCI